jgi:predicted RNase H-like HicB family nuclease
MPAYYGVIYKEESSDYGIAYPDLPGCVSASSTLEDLEPLAREGLALHIEGILEDGEKLPERRSFEEIYNEVKDHEGFVGVTLVSVPNKFKRVRVNISVTEYELGIIDNTAAIHKLDRSSFLAAAARAVASNRCKL